MCKTTAQALGHTFIMFINKPRILLLWQLERRRASFINLTSVDPCLTGEGLTPTFDGETFSASLPMVNEQECKAGSAEAEVLSIEEVPMTRSIESREKSKRYAPFFCA